MFCILPSRSAVVGKQELDDRILVVSDQSQQYLQRVKRDHVVGTGLLPHWDMGLLGETHSQFALMSERLEVKVAFTNQTMSVFTIGVL